MCLFYSILMAGAAFCATACMRAPGTTASLLSLTDQPYDRSYQQHRYTYADTNRDPHNMLLSARVRLSL